jgi:hypothetical protein
MKEELIEKIIDEVVKTSSPKQDEINAVAESPFLYRRIRNRIEENKKGDNSILNFWSDLFRIFKLVTQATAIITLLVVSLFLLAPSNSKLPGDSSSAQNQAADFDDDEMFDETIGLLNDTKAPKEVKK